MEGPPLPVVEPGGPAVQVPELQVQVQADAARSSAAKDITFGSIAGMTSKLFEHPFDLVKVRLQSQPTDRPPRFRGPVDCFKQTLAGEGWRGLYRGVSMPLVGAAAENATLFLVYNQCQEAIRWLRPHAASDPAPGLSERAKGKRRELSVGEKAVAAGGAGAAASFILTPIELIKCKMQVQMLVQEGQAAAHDATPGVTTAHRRASPATATARPPLSALPSRSLSTPATATRPPLLGPVALVRSVLATYGLRGLWLGQSGTLLRETGGSSAWFTSYEVITAALLRRREHAGAGAEALTRKDLRMWELLLAGACAGVSYNVVLFPADSVKSAMQTQAELGGSARRGFLATFRDIHARRGVRGLYAGMGVTVVRSAPSSALIFLIYETLEKRFGGRFV